MSDMHPIGNESTTAIDDIARTVRERRESNQMTQADLALLAGVGRRFLSELERGKGSLRLDKVAAVLAVFGKRVGVVDAPRPDVSDSVGATS